VTNLSSALKDAADYINDLDDEQTEEIIRKVKQDRNRDIEKLRNHCEYMYR
jgi:hypothetical protein